MLEADDCECGISLTLIIQGTGNLRQFVRMGGKRTQLSETISRICPGQSPSGKNLLGHRSLVRYVD